MNTNSGQATMTVSQTAIMLGISRTTAYECVRRGSIPSIRLGGRIIVPTQAIEQLLATSSSRAPEEPNRSTPERHDTLF